MRYAILCLLLVGCGTTVELEAPCDAGPALVDDAAAEPCPHLNERNECVEPFVTAAQACRLLENTQLAHEALRSCEPLECPWRGFSGPGAPALRCDPIRVVACVEALDRANSCALIETALAECDPNACHEVE